MDDCRSDPCTNGGTCLDGISSYTCHCSVQWTGLHCEVSKQNIIVTDRNHGTLRQKFVIIRSSFKNLKHGPLISPSESQKLNLFERFHILAAMRPNILKFKTYNSNKEILAFWYSCLS